MASVTISCTTAFSSEFKNDTPKRVNLRLSISLTMPTGPSRVSRSFAFVSVSMPESWPGFIESGARFWRISGCSAMPEYNELSTSINVAAQIKATQSWPVSFEFSSGVDNIAIGWV